VKKLLWHLLAVLCLAILISCVVAGVALAGSYTYAGTWGSKGSGNGQFDGIGGIAADASGNFYVADIGGKRIEKFSSNGTYLLQWATGATVDGGRLYAISAAFDTLLAVDLTTHAVVAAYAIPGLDRPVGVAIKGDDFYIVGEGGALAVVPRPAAAGDAAAIAPEPAAGGKK